MSDEILDDFNNTLTVLIQKLTSTLEQLTLEMNNILSEFDKYNVEFNRLKLFIVNMSKNSSLSSSELIPLTDLTQRLTEFSTSYESVFQDLYTSYSRLVDSSIIFKENFKSALTSVQKNFALILSDWKHERVRLVEETNTLKNSLTSLKDENIRLLDEKKRLTRSLESLQLSYNSLNNQFNALQQEYDLTLKKLNTLQESNIQLAKNFENTRTRLETVIKGFNRVYKGFKNLPDTDLKLPSYLLLKSIQEPISIEQLNIFFRNLESVIELDRSLLNSYVNSKSFTTALRNNYYTQVLNQVFKTLLDVEDQQRSEIERRICEIESLISDQQQTRYIHSELFKPFIKTARNLLASEQKPLGEAALKLIEQVKLKFEDPELRKTLIRRTGIRDLNLDDCAVKSFEIPLDFDNIDVSLNNLLESLNTEIFEKRRELSTLFFESWRDTALKTASESKLVSYIILSVVLKLIGKADVRDSDLHKLFKKSLFLV